VTVATAEAVAGEDLQQLESEVLAQFRRHIEDERVAHSDAQRLQLAAVRQIVRLLRPDSSAAADMRRHAAHAGWDR
jgi:F-type H+-transporting ATPase subunit epsilon